MTSRVWKTPINKTYYYYLKNSDRKLFSFSWTAPGNRRRATTGDERLTLVDVDMTAARGAHLYRSKNTTCAHCLNLTFTFRTEGRLRGRSYQPTSLLAMLMWAKRGNIWWKEWNIIVKLSHVAEMLRVHILSVMEQNKCYLDECVSVFRWTENNFSSADLFRGWATETVRCAARTFKEAFPIIWTIFHLHYQQFSREEFLKCFSMMDRVCSADTRRVIIATEQTLKRGARRSKISETTGM